MLMSALMYLPFLRAYERSLIKAEEKKIKDAPPAGQPVPGHPQA